MGNLFRSNGNVVPYSEDNPRVDISVTAGQEYTWVDTFLLDGTIKLKKNDKYIKVRLSNQRESSSGSVSTFAISMSGIGNIITFSWGEFADKTSEWKKVALPNHDDNASIGFNGTGPVGGTFKVGCAIKIW